MPTPSLSTWLAHRLHASAARARVLLRRASPLLGGVALALLAACASAPPPALPQALLADAFFDAPATPPDVAALMAVSPAMREFLRHQVRARHHEQGPAWALLDALNQHGHMRLAYDAHHTRNAAQAFDDGRGNCLSLMVMAAALAQEMGLSVTFYSAQTEHSWSRDARLLITAGHVNLGLGAPLSTPRGMRHELLVDFLPPSQIQGLALKPIDLGTVEAMYMNNRAVEALRDGAPDEAYAWARATLLRHGALPQALNTLGVVYQRRGLLPQAEQVYAYLLAQDRPALPSHRHAMANQAQVLQALGRDAEAQALLQRLARLEAPTPYQQFDRGRNAWLQGDFALARELFAQQLQRDPGNAEFHHWLGLALWMLGRRDEAQQQLQQAALHGSNPQDRARYHAKLDRLREAGRTPSP
jgi:Tetratricopeptide repeat